MFERYTEKARRVVFFARYEASNFGSPYIETEHLLLGLLRENKDLFAKASAKFAEEELRAEIDASTLHREKVSTSVDLPLSNESKRILAYAAEESERLGERHIGAEHLLLGILREEECFAAKLLKERGFQLWRLRENLPKDKERKAVEGIAPGATGEGVIEFIGTSGERIAVAGISRSAPVPRIGESVLLESNSGRQRFRVRQVQYEYRLDPPGSPHAANLLTNIRVYVAALSDDDERKLWSAST